MSIIIFYFGLIINIFGFTIMLYSLYRANKAWPIRINRIDTKRDIEESYSTKMPEKMWGGLIL
jgi:hypothetical protein